MRPPGWLRWAWWPGLALALLAFPLLGAPEGVLHFVTYLLIWAIFAIAFDMAFGMAGLLSVGHALFLAFGGYATGWLTVKAGIPFVPALLAAGAGAAVLAILFGFVALRLSGIFFALTTLALGQLAMIASDTVLVPITGGQDGFSGIPRPDLFGIDFLKAGNFLIFVSVAFMLTLAVSALIRASPFGQVLIAIRTNEVRAEQLGFNVKYFKIGVLMMSGFFAALAGGLLSSLLFFLNSSILHWSVSGDVVIMALMGGTGTLLGPVLGAVAFETVKELLSELTGRWHGIMGVLFILFVIVLPDGLAGLFRRLAARVGKRP
ncbi:MAG: branched-chain amino acid ABC transporter permease [Alphaproteobacteria bacterium]